MKKNQISLFQIIGMLLLWNQYSFIQSSTAATYTIYPCYDYTTNPSQPIYTGSFIQFDAINIITRDGQIVPLIFDSGNILSNLTNVAKNNDKITVLVGNSANNNFIQFRYYNDETSPAIATYMIPAPKNKDYIAYIEWHAKTTNGFAAGAINIYDKASIAGNTSFTIQMTGGQSLLKILPSTQKGYQVYDIYMRERPKTMKGGNFDTNTIDMSKYSYANPLDGPIFSFNQRWKGMDINGKQVCYSCNISKGIIIDSVNISLPNFPTLWNLPVYVRIHVAEQAPAKAPNLPSTIPNPPTVNGSTINLNGIPLTSVEFDAGRNFIPINITSNGIYPISKEPATTNLAAFYFYTEDTKKILLNWVYDGILQISVRINNGFVFYNVINTPL